MRVSIQGEEARRTTILPDDCVIFSFVTLLAEVVEKIWNSHLFKDKAKPCVAHAWDPRALEAEVRGLLQA